jgi:hypothetical protein
MSGSYAQYSYVGDDPAGVESAMTDLQGIGGVLGSLAGEVALGYLIAGGRQPLVPLLWALGRTVGVQHEPP